MAANQILLFSPNDIGTNLLSQAAYSAASDRLNGNQPGVASARLNNKALRQASLMASGLAQFIADRQGTDVVDTLTPAQIAAMLASSSTGQLVKVSRILVSGTWTPDARTRFWIAEVVGGGGAGGGGFATTGSTYSVGSGGGSATRGIISGTSLTPVTVTIGAAGAGASGAAGGNGGATSFGGSQAPGGGGGPTAAIGTTGSIAAGQGAPGGAFVVGAGHTLIDEGRGQPGACGFIFANFGPISGQGGASPVGGGGGTNTAGGTGGVGTTPGAGGGGNANTVSQGNTVGPTGQQGQVIVWEYGTP